MTSRFNILFTSAGRRVSLIRLFKQAITDLGLQGVIVTADLRPDAPAHFAADAHELVPHITDSMYIDRVADICEKYEIRLVVPLIDTELHVFAPHRETFRAMGVTLLVSSPETIEIGRDKRQTSDFFHRVGIPTPSLLTPASLLQSRESSPYPVMLKPSAGSASAGITKIHTSQELEFFMDYVADPIIQEFIHGDEYTLDILVDFTGKTRCVVPRLRIETRAGEVSKGMTVKHSAIMEAGKRLGQSLPDAVGCVTAQCFLKEDGSITFIEINPRFGGGFPLAAHAGANFPRWIIEWMLGRNPDIALDGWRDGVVMLRYDAEIFTTKDSLS